MLRRCVSWDADPGTDAGAVGAVGSEWLWHAATPRVTNENAIAVRSSLLIRSLFISRLRDEMAIERTHRDHRFAATTLKVTGDECHQAAHLASCKADSSVRWCTNS
jgi:hypothetical protein